MKRNLRRSYIEWNVNQATNCSGKNIIPNLVFEELKLQDKDIVVLVEYCDICKNSGEFKRNLESIGYKVKVNNKNSRLSKPQNDVLIAWKNDKFSLDDPDVDVIVPPAEGTNPEMLAVKLRDKINDTSIVVVGVRIRLIKDDIHTWEEAWKKRADQLSQMLRTVFKKYGKDEIVMCLGDFNNNRCDIENCGGKSFVDLWSIKVINDIISKYGLIRVTPTTGSSIGQENSSIPFQEDHLLVSCKFNVKLEENFYSRDFTERNKDIYLHGNDFEVYNSRIRTTAWSIPYGSGIPDHAILCGAVNIYEGSVSKDLVEEDSKLYSKEELVLSDYFVNGGETYTREELIMRLICDTSLERTEAKNLIDRVVAKNWIYDAGNNCYVR